MKPWCFGLTTGFDCSYSIRYDGYAFFAGFLVDRGVCCPSRSLDYANRKYLNMGPDEGRNDLPPFTPSVIVVANNKSLAECGIFSIQTVSSKSNVLISTVPTTALMDIVVDIFYSVVDIMRCRSQLGVLAGGCCSICVAGRSQGWRLLLVFVSWHFLVLSSPTCSAGLMTLAFGEHFHILYQAF